MAKNNEQGVETSMGHIQGGSTQGEEPRTTEGFDEQRDNIRSRTNEQLEQLRRAEQSGGEDPGAQPGDNNREPNEPGEENEEQPEQEAANKNPFSDRVKKRQASGRTEEARTASAVEKATKPLNEKIENLTKLVTQLTQQQAAPAAPAEFRAMRQGEVYEDYMREKTAFEQSQAAAPAAPQPPAAQGQEKEQEPPLALNYSDSVVQASMDALKDEFPAKEWKEFIGEDILFFDFIPPIMMTDNPKATALAITPALSRELKALAQSDPFAMAQKISEIGWNASRGIKNKNPRRRKGEPAEEDHEDHGHNPRIRATGGNPPPPDPRNLSIAQRMRNQTIRHGLDGVQKIYVE